MITYIDFSQIKPILEIAWPSSNLILLQRHKNVSDQETEDPSNAKESNTLHEYKYLIAGANNLAQIHFVTKQFDVLSKACNNTFSLSFYQKTVFFIIPTIIINWAASEEIKNSLLNRTIHFIHDNIGTLCQLASLVTAVALFQIGSTVLASVSLTFLTLGYLDRAKLLPKRCQTILHRTGFTVSMFSALAIGAPIIKCLVVLSLIQTVASRFYFHTPSEIEAQSQVITQ